MSLSVQNAMKNLRPSYSVRTTMWSAPTAKGISWNVLCRPAVLGVAEVLQLLLIHPDALPVLAPTAALATEDKLFMNRMDYALVMTWSRVLLWHSMYICR